MPEVLEADASLLEDMLAAETADEPGGNLVGKPIGTDENLGTPDAPAMITKLESAGWVTVYHTETGLPSRVNKNMLPMQLAKKLENGQRAFTTNKNTVPKVVPGKYKCLLHSAAREPWMDGEGLPTCPKSNLVSKLQVRRHMQHRHKTEWETIEERRKEADTSEERAFRKAMLQQMTGAIAGSGAVETTEAPPRRRGPRRRAKAS